MTEDMISEKEIAVIQLEDLTEKLEKPGYDPTILTAALFKVYERYEKRANDDVKIVSDWGARIPWDTK